MFEMTLANWPPVTRLLSEYVTEVFMLIFDNFIGVTKFSRDFPDFPNNFSALLDCLVNFHADVWCLINFKQTNSKIHKLWNNTFHETKGLIRCRNGCRPSGNSLGDVGQLEKRFEGLCCGILWFSNLHHVSKGFHG